MHFLQIATFYSHYLADFYRSHPGLADRSYADQLAVLLADGFGSVHLLAPDMVPLGYVPAIIIGNALSLQRAWAREHGLPMPQVEADLPAIVRAQIEYYRPDIVYLLDPVTHDGRFMQSVAWRPQLVLGWRAAAILDETDWHGIDIILSSDEGCRRLALERGAASAERFLPGISLDHLDHLSPPSAESPVDVIFIGNLTPAHGSRLRMLEAVALQARARGWQARFHASAHGVEVPDSIRPLLAPPLFGNAMYQALRDARICLNNHIDVLGGRGQNMRLFETTGSGGFLLTEDDASLPELFIPGQEVVTFGSTPDLFEKIAWYIDHPAERDRLAANGRQRCVTDHSRPSRARWLHLLIQKALT